MVVRLKAYLSFFYAFLTFDPQVIDWWCNDARLLIFSLGFLCFFVMSYLRGHR
jgi:hypothetical protein